MIFKHHRSDFLARHVRFFWGRLVTAAGNENLLTSRWKDASLMKDRFNRAGGSQPGFASICGAVVCAAIIGCGSETAGALTITNSVGLSASVDVNGTFGVTATTPAWAFGGTVSSPANLTASRGTNNLGSYSALN